MTACFATSYRQVARRLKRLGFEFNRQAAGSHEIWSNLRLCASEQTIARIRAVWEVFGLATQASYNRPWPRAG